LLLRSKTFSFLGFNFLAGVENFLLSWGKGPRDILPYSPKKKNKKICGLVQNFCCLYSNLKFRASKILQNRNLKTGLVFPIRWLTHAKKWERGLDPLDLLEK
jgi:hypothetical protein